MGRFVEANPQAILHLRTAWEGSYQAYSSAGGFRIDTLAGRERGQRGSLQENAVSINKAKVTLETKITTTDLLKGKYIIAQKGRRNYYLLIAE